MNTGATSRPTIAIQKCTLESPARHFCQIHHTEEALAESIGRFAKAGFARREEVLLITSTERQSRVFAWLRKRGVDPERQREAGMLFLDTPATVIKRLTQQGRFDEEAYRRMFQGMLRNNARVRMYADVSDYLWHRGEPDLAMKLEQIANEYLNNGKLSVFCGYLLDGLDRDSYRPQLEDIACGHNYIPWTTDDEHLRAAVDKASQEVLGIPLSVTLNRGGSQEDAWWNRLPIARRTVYWLQQNMPGAMRRVLDIARTQLR